MEFNELVLKIKNPQFFYYAQTDARCHTDRETDTGLFLQK